MNCLGRLNQLDGLCSEAGSRGAFREHIAFVLPGYITLRSNRLLVNADRRDAGSLEDCSLQLYIHHPHWRPRPHGSNLPKPPTDQPIHNECHQH